MNDFFLKSINEEASIWKLGYSYHDIIKGKARAFFSETETIFDHWNVVYPISGKLENWSLSDIRIFKDFYLSKKQNGYAMQISTGSKRTENEYFILNRYKLNHRAKDKHVLKYEKIKDLHYFTHIVSECFNFNEELRIDLFTKMKEIASKTTVKNIAFFDHNYPIGVFSLFLTENSNWFLMNYCVLPEYQGSDYAHKMFISYPIASLKGDIYTHSDNKGMRLSILPRCGFELCGSITLYNVQDK